MKERSDSHLPLEEPTLPPRGPEQLELIERPSIVVEPTRTWVPTDIPSYEEPQLARASTWTALLVVGRTLIGLWAIAAVVVTATLRSRADEGVVEAGAVTVLALSGLLLVGVMSTAGWRWADRYTVNIHLLGGHLPGRARCVTAWLMPLAATAVLALTVARLEPTEPVDVRPAILVTVFSAALWRPYSLCRRLIRSLSRADADDLIGTAYVFDLAGFGLMWWQLSSWPDPLGPDSVGSVDALLGLAAASALALLANVALWFGISRKLRSAVGHRRLACRTLHDHRHLRLRGIDPMDPDVRWALLKIRREELEAAERARAAREEVSGTTGSLGAREASEAVTDDGAVGSPPIDSPVGVARIRLKRAAESAERADIRAAPAPARSDAEPVAVDAPIDRPDAEDDVGAGEGDSDVGDGEAPSRRESVDWTLRGARAIDDMDVPSRGEAASRALGRGSAFDGRLGSVRPASRDVRREPQQTPPTLEQPIDAPANQDEVVENEVVENEVVENEVVENEVVENEVAQNEVAQNEVAQNEEAPKEVARSSGTPTREFDRLRASATSRSASADRLGRIDARLRGDSTSAEQRGLDRVEERIAGSSEGSSGGDLIDRLAKFGIAPGAEPVHHDPVLESVDPDRPVMRRIFYLEVARFVMVAALAVAAAASTWLVVSSGSAGVESGQIPADAIESVGLARRVVLGAVMCGVVLLSLWALAVVVAARRCLVDVGRSVGRVLAALVTSAVVCVAAALIDMDRSGVTMVAIAVGTLGSAVAIDAVRRIDAATGGSSTALWTWIVLTLLVPLDLWFGGLGRPIRPDDHLESLLFFSAVLSILLGVSVVLAGVMSGSIEERIRFASEPDEDAVPSGDLEAAAANPDR